MSSPILIEIFKNSKAVNIDISCFFGIEKALMKKNWLFFVFFIFFVFAHQVRATPSTQISNRSPRLITYQVKKGDTLIKIARKFGISVREIKKCNKIRGSIIRIGQVLKIPVKSPVYAEIYSTSQKVKGKILFHIVKRGESLYSIARKYGTTVTMLKKLNHLRSSLIKPGQILKIRKTPPPYKIEDPFLKFLVESPFYKTHVVKKGENIYKIAKKYGVSVIAIKTFNDLDTLRLSPGQVLKIPIKPPVNPKFKMRVRKKRIYYRVKKGDTLIKIARKFGTSVRVLRSWNHLRGSLIRVGQKLLVKVSYDYATLKNPVEKYNKKTSMKEKLQQDVLRSNFSPFVLTSEAREELKEKFIEIAKHYGIYRYKYGGNGNGYLDCSMFVKLVYNELGIDLPRTAREQFKVGKIVSKDQLMPGDLVFFMTRGRYPSHVGIYLGNNKFMHFSSSQKGLAIDSLNRPYFKKRFIGARRVLDDRILECFYEYLKKKSSS